MNKLLLLLLLLVLVSCEDNKTLLPDKVIVERIGTECFLTIDPNDDVSIIINTKLISKMVYYKTDINQISKIKVTVKGHTSPIVFNHNYFGIQESIIRCETSSHFIKKKEIDAVLDDYILKNTYILQ